MPSNVMPMMASWADSTIDASWEVAARTCLCSLMIERARNAVKERTFSWLLYIRIGHCRSFKNLKCQKRYSAKRRGLGYSPRDPHPVNHRVGAKCPGCVETIPFQELLCIQSKSCGVLM